MLGHKHTFGKKEFNIIEEFIDREEAKKLYLNKLNNCTNDLNVLVFYGVGGIGKSKLRKEICRINKENYENILTMYLDLNVPEDRNLGTGILKLVDSCDGKVDFKTFELAYAKYFMKKYPSETYGRDAECFVDNPIMGIIFNTIGIFDNGVAGTVAEILERVIRKIFSRPGDKDVREELEKFDEYSISDIEERLPMFLRYDLENYAVAGNLCTYG